MSDARTILIERAQLLRSIAGRDDLVAKPPAESHWNEHARLVRASLCLGSFTALEEFIQARIRECIALLRGFPPASPALPDAMKFALVNGAFDSLSARIKDPSRFGINDINSFILAQAKRISSFSSAGIDPSDLALSTNSSNLSWAVIENALSAFSIENAPSVVGGVARRLEGGIFSAKDHFENMTTWRHKVAHVSGTDVPLAEAREFVSRLTLFCAAFDFSISTGALRILDNAHLMCSTRTRNVDVKIRFIESQGRRWRNISEGSNRATSRHLDREAARISATALARHRKECVAIRIGSETSAIDSWATPFL